MNFETFEIFWVTLKNMTLTAGKNKATSFIFQGYRPSFMNLICDSFLMSFKNY